jgi:hypothetical protein
VTAAGVRVVHSEPAAVEALQVPATSRVGRRQLLALAAVAPLAANAEDPPVDCLASCIAECTKLAPGNDAYCESQCQEFCSNNEVGAPPPTSAGKTGGIFGDSGVSYSNDVEDLLATAFGAKRQSKNVRDADVEGYAADVGNALTKAVAGDRDPRVDKFVSSVRRRSSPP